MAVTAYPVILIDSTDTNASDSNASGAGPSTAITGSNASTSADGLTVTLDGSPNLASVAADGSHVIYLEDTTTGNRRFAAINGVDNVAKTVTVEQAYAFNLTGKSWAIGGVRATLFGSSSGLLIEHFTNDTGGDAQAGWTMEMQSGHSETTAQQYDIGRNNSYGNTTAGDITIRGAKGVSDANIPTVNFSASSPTWGFFRILNSYIRLEDFKITASNVGGYSGAAISLGVPNCSFRGLIIGDTGASHTGFGYALILSTLDKSSYPLVENCCLQNNVNGIVTNSYRGINVRNCIIRNNSGYGIYFNSSSANLGSHFIDGCLIVDNGGHGIVEDAVSAARSVHGASKHITKCTISNNGGDGIRIPSNSTSVTWAGRKICDCIITGNSGYAINCTGTIVSDQLNAEPPFLSNNIIYSNTSGTVTPSAVSDLLVNTSLTNPQFADESSGDYRPSSVAAGLAISATRRGISVSSDDSVGALAVVSSGGGGSTFHPLG
jgi:hypothetical protein